MKRADLIREIQRLKQERKALILVHNYQRPEIQGIADHLGDSLDLARIASRCLEDVIVFCGVHFMAESAKILSPQKTVLLPEPDAGCPLADCASPEQVQEARSKYPDALFVAYINTSAEVKALCDICVTSANAHKIIKQFPEREIVYLPDRNLATYVESVLDRRIIKWPGQCYVHDHLIQLDAVKELKRDHPKAVLMAHPEAPMTILEMSDVVTGTSGMLKEVAERTDKSFIVATEIGLVDRMRNEFPDRVFHPIPGAVCSQMKLTTLQSVYDALTLWKTNVTVPEPTARLAKQALDRMLELS
jgi:quinolinate synthase